MCLGSLVLTIDTSVYISYKAIRYKLYVYKWLSLLPKGTVLTTEMLVLKNFIFLIKLLNIFIRCKVFFPLVFVTVSRLCVMGN